MADAGLLAAAREIVRSAAERDGWLLSLRIAGIAWASVELERAAEELTAAFRRGGMPEPRWSPGTRDEALGATAWISREPWLADGMPQPPAILLLEPDTEGRLAATLARFGEGVGAVYLVPEPGATRVDAARLGRARPGPLGSARLVLARPAWGPNVLVLGR